MKKNVSKKIIVMLILVVMFTGIVSPVFAADDLVDQLTGMILNPTALSSFLDFLFKIVNFMLTLFPMGPLVPSEDELIINADTTMYVGDSVTLWTENAYGITYFESSDTSVVTVTNSVAKGEKAGTATIRVWTSSGQETEHVITVYDRNSINISEDAMKFLAGVINAEAGNTAYSDYRKNMAGVGYVVKNRMGGTISTDNLMKALTKSEAFSTVGKSSSKGSQTYTYNGTKYYTKSYTATTLEVARAVMSGTEPNPIGTRQHFWDISLTDSVKRNHRNAITIGDNTFFDW